MAALAALYLDLIRTRFDDSGTDFDIDGDSQNNMDESKLDIKVRELEEELKDELE
jgi:hypothetical protein